MTNKNRYEQGVSMNLFLTFVKFHNTDNHNIIK